MLNLKKYQAFNMDNDYRQQVECPYGCNKQLIEEQLSIHISKCSRRDDELFGHCKFNYFHIIPITNIKEHEVNCPSETLMTEEDFAYNPEPTYDNQNLSWIQDEASLLYAQYFVASSPVVMFNKDQKETTWFQLKQQIQNERQEKENLNTESTIDEVKNEQMEVQTSNNINGEQLENVEALGQSNKSSSLLKRIIEFFEKIIHYLI